MREIKYSEESINSILNALNNMEVKGFQQMEIVLGIKNELTEKGVVCVEENKESEEPVEETEE